MWYDIFAFFNKEWTKEKPCEKGDFFQHKKKRKGKSLSLLDFRSFVFFGGTFGSFLNNNSDDEQKNEEECGNMSDDWICTITVHIISTCKEID